MSADSELTERDALASVVSVGRAVIAALGTRSWVLTEGPGADDCTRSDGTTGVVFSWAAHGPAGTDRTRDAATARGALEKRGYTVYTQPVPNGAIRVVGRSHRLGVVEFDARTTANSVAVTSGCVVGRSSDYDDLEPEQPEPSPTST